MHDDFTVSVCLITYNQKLFIKQAIDSVIDQRTEFKYELIIGDDCSTDGTREILIEYQKKYPHIIQLILHPKKNEGLPGKINFLSVIYAARGKYIALLDGDDYWYDEHKLQKQVDFLENHPDYVLCFTRGFILNTFSGTQKINLHFEIERELTIPDFIKGNDQLTATVLFRNETKFKLPGWFLNSHGGDWGLYLLLMHNTNCKAICLRDITAVYRIHSSGIHGNHHQSKMKLIEAYKMHLSFYDSLKKYLFFELYNEQLNNAISAKVAMITKLCCHDNSFIRGIGFNLKYLLRGLSIQVFFSNLIMLQKNLIKSIIR